MANTLSKSQAARIYDRIGRLQDTQRFYEDAATAALIAAGDMHEARSVFEAGCGTGRLARRLLERVIPAQATYLGVDASTTMASLAAEKVARFGDRARIVQADATTYRPPANQKFDRYLTAFCVDLLSEEDVARLLERAHDMLAPEGLLCAAGLTEGPAGLPRVISATWKALHRVAPQLLGGCRPLHLCAFLDPSHWLPVHHQVVCAFGLCSEVLVARRVSAR